MTQDLKILKSYAETIGQLEDAFYYDKISEFFPALKEKNRQLVTKSFI